MTDEQKNSVFDEIARDMRELIDGVGIMIAQGAVIGIPAGVAVYLWYGWWRLWGGNHAAPVPVLIGTPVIIYLAFGPLRRWITRKIEQSGWYQRMKDRYGSKDPDDERLRGAVIEDREIED